MKNTLRICVLINLAFACCACSSQRSLTHASEDFLSETYNHFDSGVMFADIETGLDVLWRASFKKNNAFKENLAYFVRGGLLILPNHQNTCCSARLSALQVTVCDNELFVRFKDEWLEVFAIIHTHPERYTLPMPSPGKDYQFCYTGIHNYVMDRWNLYDAYKDSNGNECYRRLGSRADYATLPFPIRRYPIERTQPSLDSQVFVLVSSKQ